jgi:hypothetical protein
MRKKNMSYNESPVFVLWIEDQYHDLDSYLNPLRQAGFFADRVVSVTEAIEKLKDKSYSAVIFDLNILAGSDPDWQEFERKLDREKQGFEPHLGFWLLRAIFSKKNWDGLPRPDVQLDANSVGVFTVVGDINIWDEIESFGIKKDRIVAKSASQLTLLLDLVLSILETPR